MSFKCNDTWQTAKWNEIKAPTTAATTTATKLQSKENETVLRKQTFNVRKQTTRTEKKNALLLEFRQHYTHTIYVPQRTTIFSSNDCRIEWNVLVVHGFCLTSVYSHLFHTVEFGIESVGTLIIIAYSFSLFFSMSHVSIWYLCHRKCSYTIVNRNATCTIHAFNYKVRKKAHSHKLCQKSKTCF